MLVCFRCGLIPCLLVLVLQAWAAADVVLDDSDWRSPSLVASAEGVEHEILPSLLLKTQFKEPVFLFDATDDETITRITDFQGKLYLGSCTKPAMTATGSVFTYDPETNEWEKVFQVNEQGLVRLEVYGDRLYIPGYDANDGGWDLGSIYVHDGKTWVEHRTVPRAIHIYGLAVYRDRIYVSANVLDPPSAGLSIGHAYDKGLINCYGRVLSSGDGGLTWREDYRSPLPRPGMGPLTTFGDELVLNAYGDLLIFDGKQWRPLGLSPNALVVFDWAPAGDTLLIASSLGLCFLRGDSLTRPFYVPFFEPARAAVRFGDSYVVLQTYTREGLPLLGAAATHYPNVHEDADRPRSVIRAFPVSLLDRVVTESLFGAALSEQVTSVRFREVAVSAHAFAGRLYLGTHPEGRVLVLPVAQKGALDSAPRPIRERGTYSIEWESTTPPGTSCRFQVRTAPTREALESAPFVGPDGETSSFFENSDTEFEIAEPGFLQYRVLLATDDPALTPYLKRVTVRAAR
jgi:hypothetical protein